MTTIEIANPLRHVITDEGSTVTSVYDLLRRQCGLSQKEAADFHDARLDTVVSWCNDRRKAPAGVIDELRDLFNDMTEAGHSLAYLVQLIPQFDDAGDPFIRVGLPHDDKDAVVCGFPCQSVCEAAVGLAIAELPRGIPVRLVPRVRGSIPTAVTQKRAQNNKITVYHFKVWDAQNGVNVIPPRMSPLERIKSIGGEPITDSAKRVEVSALDEHGRFDPLANQRTPVVENGLITRLHVGGRYTSGEIQFDVIAVDGDEATIKLTDGSVLKQQVGALLYMKPGSLRRIQ